MGKNSAKLRLGELVRSMHVLNKSYSEKEEKLPFLDGMLTVAKKPIPEKLLWSTLAVNGFLTSLRVPSLMFSINVESLPVFYLGRIFSILMYKSASTNPTLENA